MPGLQPEPGTTLKKEFELSQPHLYAIGCESITLIEAKLQQDLIAPGRNWAEREGEIADSILAIDEDIVLRRQERQCQFSNE